MESSIPELLKWLILANAAVIAAQYAVSCWRTRWRWWGAPQPRPKAPRDCWKRTGARQPWRMEDGDGA